MSHALTAPTIHDPVALQGYQHELYKQHDLTLLATAQATSSESLDFTSGIDGKYKKIVFEIDIVPTSDDVGLNMRVSVDAGTSWVSTGNLYDWAIVGRSGPTNLTANDASANEIGLIPGGDLGGTNAIGNGIREGCRFDVEMRLASDDSYFTEFNANNIFWWTADAETCTAHLSGGYLSTNIVDAVQFFPESGYISTGTIKMYGYADRP